MTPEQAAALRAPFPPEAIGRLPKGGTMLSYVGHAATTDRLLQVDPDWSWEPPTADELQRLPGGEGMWIKLTVCGVTRFGWGDGKNIKEWISDAIRNAAMRFGVALDLWSKEDLRHENAEESGGAPSEGATPPTASSAPSADGALTGTTAERAGVPTDIPTSADDRLAASSGSGPPLSKSKLAHLKSDLKFVHAAGVKVDGYRREWALPPLNEECTVEELERWGELLSELKAVAPVKA